jgi:hypothetical protein
MLKSEFAWVKKQNAPSSPQKAQKTLKNQSFLGQNHGLSESRFFAVRINKILTFRGKEENHADI